MKRDAVISPCGTYRYELVRRWKEGPLLGWVMLNPSTADGTIDDPSVRRCIGFGIDWGYAGIVIRNAYALRATDPAQLTRHPDPIGPDNDAYLERCADDPLTVLAWGAHGGDRAALVAERLRHTTATLRCLGTTKHGAPRHPLYIPKTALPVEYLGGAA
jgi:hypothetical protein